MAESDFGELYAYLKCFHSTYAIEEETVEHLLEVIAWVYAQEYDREDPMTIRYLRNPRGAGRKQKTSQEMAKKIKELSRSGMSIRQISEETGVPKSTVQRLL